MYVARYIAEHDHRRGQVGDPRCLPVVLVDTAYFCTYNKRGRNGDPIRLREKQGESQEARTAARGREATRLGFDDRVDR